MLPNKRRFGNFIVILLLSLILVAMNYTANVAAFSKNDLNSLMNNTPFYDPYDTIQSVCAITPVTSNDTLGAQSNSAPVSASNTDYAGHAILSEAELNQIKLNAPIYQQAAQQVGIPWQILAALHLHEHALKVSNPSNGQGVYQIDSKAGGPYPPGPISLDEFLRQSIFAAQFLKDKATSANYPNNRNLSTNADATTVKDTFFSYNGRGSLYLDQAAALGFDRNSQGFEGSPYVMNKADAKRDPAVTTLSWQQYGTGPNGSIGDATDAYGAFVVYAALAGVAIGSACNGTSTVNCSGAGAQSDLSETRRKVVCIAQNEYHLWQSKQLTPGVASYGKYSQNNVENWCADFASWTYDQAGYPLQPDPGWRVPGVSGIQSIGEKEQKFHWHPAGSYTPKPGDLVIHGGDHVNLVIGISGNKMTLIGGNQDADSRGYPNGSSVTQYLVDGYSGVNGITGYVSPD